jgi:hypothetical protein
MKNQLKINLETTNRPKLENLERLAKKQLDECDIFKAEGFGNVILLKSKDERLLIAARCKDSFVQMRIINKDRRLLKTAKSTFKISDLKNKKKKKKFIAAFVAFAS